MNLSKTQKNAKLLCIISIIALLVPIGSFIASIVTSVSNHLSGFSPTLISNAVMMLISAAVTVNVILLLHDIHKGDTPFKDSNVRRLKMTGILLIVIEPLQQVFQFISNHFFVATVNNEAIVEHTSLGGFVFAAGLAVLCIAFVFNYGTELQKQSDETL